MHPELSQPFLMVICLLAKHEIDELMVAILHRAEWDQPYEPSCARSTCGRPNLSLFLDPEEQS